MVMANKRTQGRRGWPDSITGGGSITAANALPGTNTQENWNLDGLGNWRATGFIPVGGSQTSDQRNHNYINEITQSVTNNLSPVTFVYDGATGASNGNLKNDGALICSYFATVADYQAYIANPTGITQPNETIIYAYYTAADVQNAVTGAFAGSVKSITDNLITPAAGDPRSPYTNVTTFQYDSNGNVVQESGPSGTINYVYNTATQRHTETWTGTDYANAVTDIVYGYNNMGELASVTVLKENGQTPAAVASSTIYDALGNTSTTTLPNTVYTYDAGGRLETTLDSATGITIRYTYKPDTNYVSTETVSDPSVSSVNSVAIYSYTYRADGLKTGETDQTLNSDGTTYDTRTLAWTYDGLDRLTQETSTDTAGAAALNYIDAYSYDLDSNRVQETIENGSGTVTDTINSTYNADNELTQSVDANNGTTTYQYDNNGSQIGTASPIGTSASEYTLQGKLAGIQNKNGAGTVTSSATYIYDDQGNRIEVTTITGTNSPVTTYYLVDGNNPTGYAQVIEQSSTPGTPTITYIWGGSLIEQDNAAGTANAGTYYLIADAQGSTQMLVNSGGDVVQTYNYDSSGNALGFTPSSAITEYLYNQQYYDVISGQYYFRARDYDPATGTFTQQDSYTVNPGDMANANLYLYAGADPINMFDPSGRMELADVLTSISIMTAIVGIAPVAAAGVVSLKDGLPDAWSLGAFFEIDFAGLAGGAVMSRLLVGAEITLFPRVGEAQVSLFGPTEFELDAHPNTNTVLDWLQGSTGQIPIEAGFFQAWYWGARPSAAGPSFGLGFLGYELGNGTLAGAERGPGGEHGMFSGFTVTKPNAGGFLAGGGEFNFSPFHMSEAAMVAAASIGEGIFTFGLGSRLASEWNLGGLAAAVVDGGATAAWVGWTYG